MKLVERTKGFIIGIITCILVTSIVYAEPLEKTITAFYNDVRIYVDGLLIEPEDVNGNPVEPFIYNGTTYLPVRAISEALDKTVEWDEETNSVYIGEKPEPGITVVSVSNETELINAIASNTKILLKPGTYNLSKAITDKTINSENVSVVNVFDGSELILSDVKNLTIQGSGAEPSEILVGPRYANVLTFTNADNINIKNIRAGHTEDKGYCTGGVFVFKYSKNISISGSELFGCGTQGLVLDNVDTLNFSNSVIDECTYHIMTLNSSKNIKFFNSKFINNEMYEQIKVKKSQVVFENCEISYNKASTIYSAFFDVDTLSKVLVRNSRLEDNSSVYFISYENVVEFENCIMENNTYNSMYKDQIAK